MAISAISSISAGGFVRPFRLPLVGAVEPPGKSGPIPRVAPIPSLAGREAAASPDEAATAADARRPQDPPRSPAIDPRTAASLLALPPGSAEGRMAAGRAAAGGRAAVDAQDPLGADKRRDAQARLDELMGQRGALERRQAEQKNASSAEVVSELAQLKSRDSEVRAHEAAHMAAGGRYITGGASYTYQRGPDGGQYAVGGEVGIDTSPVPGHPEETAQKMRTVRAAALAPSDPSSADLSVAASAAEAEAAAMAEIAQERAMGATGVNGAMAATGVNGASGDGPGAAGPRSAGGDADAIKAGSADARKTEAANGVALAGREGASAPRRPLNMLA